MDEVQEQKEKKYTKGGWNLLVLGIIAIVIATATTGVSLMIYHNSGDIYLDRSRPGFLPDEEEIEEEEVKEEEYNFSKTGKMSAEVVNEYLKNLEEEVKAIDDYEKPFEKEALSDEHLGIPIESESSAEEEE
ncbi:hypothetical protein IKG33_01490 [Candidatus Saccharibacteria bacterium]|nr:hypothetical protein [Candidatus Saccharibacteria bacterium]